MKEFNLFCNSILLSVYLHYYVISIKIYTIMRNLLLLFIFLSFSCGKENEDNKDENLDKASEGIKKSEKNDKLKVNPDSSILKKNDKSSIENQDESTLKNNVNNLNKKFKLFNENKKFENSNELNKYIQKEIKNIITSNKWDESQIFKFLKEYAKIDKNKASEIQKQIESMDQSPITKKIKNKIKIETFKSYNDFLIELKKKAKISEKVEEGKIMGGILEQITKNQNDDKRVTLINKYLIMINGIMPIIINNRNHEALIFCNNLEKELIQFLDLAGGHIQDKLKPIFNLLKADLKWEKELKNKIDIDNYDNTNFKEGRSYFNILEKILRQIKREVIGEGMGELFWNKVKNDSEIIIKLKKAYENLNNDKDINSIIFKIHIIEALKILSATYISAENEFKPTFYMTQYKDKNMGKDSTSLKYPEIFISKLKELNIYDSKGLNDYNEFSWELRVKLKKYDLQKLENLLRGLNDIKILLDKKGEFVYNDYLFLNKFKREIIYRIKDINLKPIREKERAIEKEKINKEVKEAEQEGRIELAKIIKIVNQKKGEEKKSFISSISSFISSNGGQDIDINNLNIFDNLERKVKDYIEKNKKPLNLSNLANRNPEDKLEEQEPHLDLDALNLSNLANRNPEDKLEEQEPHLDLDDPLLIEYKRLNGLNIKSRLLKKHIKHILLYL